jgi:peptidoglycan/LPS O-acetylase OafA/YrhL
MSNPKSELKYIPGLDSLRALACLSVVFFHSNLVEKSTSSAMPFKGGYFGVDLFFVLSGYLITTILINQYAKEGTIHFKNFYIKRILRLYPPILISVLVFLVPLLFTDRPAAIANIVSLMTYTADCFMFVQHFTHLPYALLASHSWSLAVEEQYYITFPLLLFFLLRYYSKVKKSNLIAFFPFFLLLYSLVVIVASILLGAWFYKFFLWRFFEIYLGAFIAIFYSRSFERMFTETPLSLRIKKRVQGVYGNKIVFLASIVFTVWYLVYPQTFPFGNYLAKYNFQYILFTLACSVIIINTVYPSFRSYSKFLESKWLVFTGKMSYGLYLYSAFIGHYVGSILYNDNPFASTRTKIESDIITIVVSLLFSALSYLFIEKNILKLKTRFESPAVETGTLQSAV